MTADGGDPVIVNPLPSTSTSVHATFEDVSPSQPQSQSQPPHVVTDYPNGIYMCSVSDSSVSHSESADDDRDVSSGSKNGEHEGAHDGKEKQDDESRQNSTGNDGRRVIPLKRKPETEKANVVEDGGITGIVTTSSEQGKYLPQLITNVFTGVPDWEQSKGVDILMVASAVGIRFDPPSWWPPGGFDMVKWYEG